MEPVAPCPLPKRVEDVAAAGRQVQHAGLQRRRQAEDRVEDVADGLEQGVHVPGAGRGGRDDAEQAPLPVQGEDSGRVRARDARKGKKAARLGAGAVPMEALRNRVLSR